MSTGRSQEGVFQNYAYANITAFVTCCSSTIRCGTIAYLGHGVVDLVYSHCRVKMYRQLANLFYMRGTQECFEALAALP